MRAAVIPFVKSSDWIKMTPQLDKKAWEKETKSWVPPKDVTQVEDTELSLERQMS